MFPLRNTRSMLGLTLISAGSLAFEISLTRLFAVQQFHHFAFVVVSLAVMGIAASGLLLALRPKHPPLAGLSSAFAASAALAYVTINLLPFDSYSIAWDRQQVWILVLYFLISGAPFLFAGWTVGACLSEAGPEAHRPYAANLVGSALGCPAALAALSLFGGEGAVALAIMLGLLAAFTFTPRRNPRIILAILSALTLLAGIRPTAALSIHLSPYKPLSITSLVPDAKTAFTRWSASARLDVVESSSVHVLPGLSLNADIQLPLQAAMFIDGDGPMPINALSPDDPNAQAIATHMPASLAYDLRPNARALILMPGAGLDAVVALAAGASKATLAIDEPLIRHALTGPYADFSYNLLRHPRLDVSERLGRGALRASGENYDLIQFALSDPYRPVTSGAFSLMENYTLTVEAFSEAYQRLTDDGLLVITRWLGTPPSESARTWATLLAALKNQEIADPAPRLIAYRSMRTATMIAARKPFSPDELETTRAFLETNGFDPIFLPDLDPAELNRYLRLPQDTYHEIFTALLTDPEATIAAYEFNLSPPTDNRPFFFHFFRWRQTPDVIATLGQTWQPFGGSGYLVLLALLGLMLTLALPLALAPVLVLGRKLSWSSVRVPALIYFACLGAGYLLVEIPLIQRLTLLLNRPAQALATVLFTLLLSSGIGSLLSTRLDLRKALVFLLLLLALTTATLPTAIRVALPWELGARLAFAILLITPIGLLMGIPFAAGLRILETRSPGSIPWAWAINGAVSGVSGVLAAIVSLDWGYTVTMTIGAIAYLIGLVTVFRLDWLSSSKENN
jgi:hypothetical protein